MRLAQLNPFSWFAKSAAPVQAPAPEQAPAEVKRKVVGEQELMALFPGWNVASFASWSANRSELVQHWRGWNYVAGRAIAEEIAGMRINLAYRRTPGQVEGLRSKALALPTASQRWAALRSIDRKFLSRAARRKALAGVQGHEELEPAEHTHPLYQLFEQPNSLDCSWQFLYKLAMYLELTGITYIWVVKGRNGLPAALWVLPSQWVFPRSGDGKIIAWYEVRPSAGYVSTDYGMGWFPGGGGRLPIDADDIIEISYPNPVNFFDGFSPVTAQGAWIDASEGIDYSRVAHFQNGMFPGVAIEVDREVLKPDENEIKAAMKQIAAKYAGVRKTKEPVCLSPGLKLVVVKQTPEEMDYVNSADQMRRHQMAGHRVGPSVIGMAEHGTFASMIADRAGFHQSVIKPKTTLLGQILTVKLAHRFDPDLVAYWFDSAPEDPDLKLRQYDTGFKNGAVTPNEYRQDILHLPAFEHGGDDPLVPMTLSPIGLGTGTPEEELPSAAAAADRWEEPEQDRMQLAEEGQAQGGDKRGALAGRLLANPKLVQQQVMKYFAAMQRSK